MGLMIELLDHVTIDERHRSYLGLLDVRSHRSANADSD